MKEFARKIRTVIEKTEPNLSKMNQDETEFKPAPREWSKKEILGHLIDSAANNHQRFVRAVNQNATRFPTYNQEEWVRIQQYRDSSWPLLISLWVAYNKHLSHIIEKIPETALSSPCNIGKKEPVPLAFVIEDYLRHLKHHLVDILSEDPNQLSTNIL